MPPASYYLENLNLDKVAEEILNGREGEKPVSDFDFRDAKTAVWAAAEAWLSRDIHDLRITKIEQKERMEIMVPLIGMQGIRQVKDIEGIVLGKTSLTKDFAGRKAIVDWKTSNTLDVRWRERMIDSLQWRLYAYDDTDLFFYRGITREGDTREVAIEVPWTNKKEVDEIIAGIANQRHSLVVAGLEIWPRKFGMSTCHAYGDECPFFADCRGYEGIPRKAIEDSDLSFTEIERFLLCPEKSRRLKLLPSGYDGTEATAFGSIVHRGLAELWRQASEKFGND